MKNLKRVPETSLSLALLRDGVAFDGVGTLFNMEEFILGEVTFIKKLNHPKGLFKCFCGKEFIASIYDVRYNKQKSCGCYNTWRKTQGNKKHGLRYNRIYLIFLGMKKRCYNPNSKPYPRYGGRGIKICDEWLKDFVKFYEWSLSNGYADNLTIDRRDNDGDYTPDNCRWTSMSVQARNRGLLKNNKTGVKGVSMDAGKYVATISLNGKAKHLGTFNTLEEAARVYETARLERDKDLKTK